MSAKIMVVKVNPVGRSINRPSMDVYRNTNLKLKVGDTVVIDLKRGPQTGIVKEILPEDARSAKRWVIQKVNMGPHNTRTKKLARAAELRDRLQVKMDAWKEEEAWKVMADTDPEAKRLMKELKGLEA